MRNQKHKTQRLRLTAINAIGTVAMIGATVVALLNLPDLVRYFRMRRM